MDRLLRQSEVCTAVALSRMAVWKLRKAGDFPQPVVLGVGALRWRESDVQAWIASR